MTIEKSSNGQKLSKTQRRIKRDEATRLAKLMLSSTQAANENIEKFSNLIDELDNSKDPSSKRGPGGKPISSIFDLDILREKKYTLQSWVNNYKSSKSSRVNEEQAVSV